jgi:acyl-coenzyme A synthetase/AMP-(fatty) acid ligase
MNAGAQEPEPSLFEALHTRVSGDTAAVTGSGGRLSLRTLLEAAERLAPALASLGEAGNLISCQVAEPAATAVVALAADLAAVPLAHLDPAAPAAPPGPVVRDTRTYQPAPRTTRFSTGHDGVPALFLRGAEQDADPAGLPPRCQVFYTSGSTGTPIGVVRRARAVLADCARIAGFLGYEDGRPVLSVAPAFHSYGFTYGLFAPLLHGAPSVHRAVRSLPSQLARTAELLRPAALIGLPFVFELMVRSSAPMTLPGVRHAVSSAAPLSPETAAAVARAASFTLYNGYGSSETGAVSLAGISADPARTALPGEVGAPLPGIEARLAQEDPDGHDGELLLLTDSLADGDLGPNGLLPLPALGPWYRTGDLADLDGGSIRLLGRVGDIINVAGEKVHPGQIEDVVLRHPAVAEAHVFAAPDPVRGQVPVARVVCRAELSEEELLNWLRPQLAPHQLPRRVEFVAELPRSATGKRIRQVAA